VQSGHAGGAPDQAQALYGGAATFGPRPLGRRQSDHVARLCSPGKYRHGDELTAVSIVFRWIDNLSKPDQPARRFHWRVVPVLNPDGLLAKPPSRVNANKVDLNRNFPTPNWLKEAPRYWENRTKRDPRRFPGNAPLSEPESRLLHDEVEQFKPDVIVSIHAPYGVLDFDGPPKGIAAPSRFGRLHLNRVGIYPGSLGNFGSNDQGIPVVTLELPHALNMPTEAELSHVWADMQDWLRVNLVERQAQAVAGLKVAPSATTQTTPMPVGPIEVKPIEPKPNEPKLVVPKPASSKLAHSPVVKPPATTSAAKPSAVPKPLAASPITPAIVRADEPTPSAGAPAAPPVSGNTAETPSQ
jgi:Zinc carboxypeptidase